jgi:hypothetical protein
MEDGLIEDEICEINIVTTNKIFLSLEDLYLKPQQNSVAPKL